MKKFLALFLAAGINLTLFAGCGESTSDGETSFSPEPTVTESSAPSETATEEPAEPVETEEPEEKTEEPSEEDIADQSVSEPAEPEESREEEVTQDAVELPSADDIYNLAEPLSLWAANVYFDIYATNSTVGKIYLDTNRAVELAGVAASDEGKYNAEPDISADVVETYLKKMFGSQFNLSDFTNTDFTNTVDQVGEYEYGSAFSAEYPNYESLEWLHRKDDGNFHVDVLNRDCVPYVSNITIKSIVPNDDATCTATVEYDVDNSSPLDNLYNTWSLDISFDLIPDEEAECGWAITSFAISDGYNHYTNIDY